MRKVAVLVATIGAFVLAGTGASAMAATQDLCSGSWPTGSWDIFYDTTAKSIDLNASGQASSLILTVTVISTGQQASFDATPFLNAGNVVLVGRGSVLGLTTQVPQSALPVVAKGQPYPYTCDAQVTP